MAVKKIADIAVNSYNPPTFYLSRPHAPHGNAVWMRRIQSLPLKFLLLLTCTPVSNGLHRRPGWVPLRRMGTRRKLNARCSCPRGVMAKKGKTKLDDSSVFIPPTTKMEKKYSVTEQPVLGLPKSSPIHQQTPQPWARR